MTPTVSFPPKSFAALAAGVLFSALLSLAAQAQPMPEVASDQVFGNYRVVFSAFNSSFVQPDIATRHNITRGRDRGLVNIALIEGDRTTGRPAIINGTVTDIMSRQRALEFFEVREGDAVYYLAPFSFSHQDPLTFRINVQAEEDGTVMPVSFQRTFYRD